MTTELTTAPTGAVVVGVDGSALSNEALAWAAAEAERLGAPLHVFHAFVYVPVLGGFSPVSPAEHESLGGEVVHAAADKVRASHPDLPVTEEVRLGPAAPRLLNAAKDARMIVLGARGHGRVGGVLVGSVSQQVAMHAKCPVVVVRGSADHAGGPVLVGMDGSPEAGAALRFGLRHADAVGAPVRVVRAEYLDSPPGIPPGEWYADLVDRLHEMTESVRAEVETARGEFPGLDVDFRVTRRHPVDALVEEAAEASLVVVASRGLGGFAGLLLGSVSQGVLSRAPAPVAILPHSRGARQYGEERQIP